MRIALLGTLAACTGPGTATDGKVDDTGTPPGPTFTLPPDLVLEDDGNIAFSQTWTLAASEIHANAAEVFLSWDGKTSDAWGVERAPDSYGRLVFWKLGTTRSDALARLAVDDLDPVVLDRWELDVAGQTDAELSATGFDPPTALVEDDAVSWLLALVDDAGPRDDLRDGVFLVPRVAQPGINLAIPDTAGHTEWSMRFGDDELRTDEGHERYSIDFSALTVNAYGQPFDVARVDRVFVGRFDGVDEADDLGGDLLDLPAVAAGWWTVGTGGFAHVDLAGATDAAGARFPGFTGDAQWLLGGVCTSCLGPAPQFLTIVEVRVP